MKRPPRKHKQGAVTKGKLEFEVTLHFKFWPSGWAGNDHMAFDWAYRALNALIDLPIWQFRMEESVKVGAIRWRRPGETWQRWKRPVR
jgi:hypothetical protein